MMFRHASPTPAHRRAPILAVSALTVLAGCGETPSSPPEPRNSQMSQRAAEPAAPALAPIPPALTRKDLLDASTLAASEYATGQKPTDADPLVGRSFAVRIAFGCDSPAPSESAQPGVARWEWGESRRTIRLALTPANWKESDFIEQADTEGSWEAVEGFWITRPWILSETCPIPTEDPPTATPDPSAQTLGLAAVFDAGGSRVGRRDGRPYQLVVRARNDSPLHPPEHGYRLLLEGRVEAFPDGRAIRCRGQHSNRRPVCIVAMRLDRVAFEEADGADLAEWRSD